MKRSFRVERMKDEAYRLERTQRLHETRLTRGLVNRVTPLRWRIHHDDRINRRCAELVEGPWGGFKRAIRVGGLAPVAPEESLAVAIARDQLLASRDDARR